MLKRIGIMLIAVAVGLSATVPGAMAAEKRGSAEADADKVTQGELALLLVNVLGLYRFLPAAPTVQEAISVLLANGIQPSEGWQPDKEVLRADLARVITLAIDRADEVENPDDPESWVQYLAGMGIPIDTIGLALTNVEPLAEPIASHVFTATVTTDPLKKQAVFGEPDESEFGTDVEFIASRPLTFEEVERIIEVVPQPPPRPRPVTPD